MNDFSFSRGEFSGTTAACKRTGIIHACFWTNHVATIGKGPWRPLTFTDAPEGVTKVVFTHRRSFCSCGIRRCPHCHPEHNGKQIDRGSFYPHAMTVLTKSMSKHDKFVLL